MPEISLGTYLPGHKLSQLKTVAFKPYFLFIPTYDYSVTTDVGHIILSQNYRFSNSGQLFCHINP